MKVFNFLISVLVIWAISCGFVLALDNETDSFRDLKFGDPHFIDTYKNITATVHFLFDGKGNSLGALLFPLQPKELYKKVGSIKLDKNLSVFPMDEVNKVMSEGKGFGVVGTFTVDLEITEYIKNANTTGYYVGIVHKATPLIKEGEDSYLKPGKLVPPRFKW